MVLKIVINTYLNQFSFGYTSDGKPGYKVGASTEITPFKGGNLTLVDEVSLPTDTLNTGDVLEMYTFQGKKGKKYIICGVLSKISYNGSVNTPVYSVTNESEFEIHKTHTRAFSNNAHDGSFFILTKELSQDTSFTFTPANTNITDRWKQVSIWVWEI